MEKLFNNVSRETMQKLERYVSMLMVWNKSINLVARCDVEELWGRHVFDSMELINHIDTQKNIVDVGSGGGLPAIVIAICMPSISVKMIESDQRKSIFLQEVVRELHLKNASVLNVRCEKCSPLNAEIITARACAPLYKMFEIASIHLAENAKMLLLKGAKVDEEIIQAREKKWLFDCDLYDNRFSDGFVVQVKNLCRV